MIRRYIKPTLVAMRQSFTHFKGTVLLNSPRMSPLYANGGCRIYAPFEINLCRIVYKMSCEGEWQLKLRNKMISFSWCCDKFISAPGSKSLDLYPLPHLTLFRNVERIQGCFLLVFECEITASVKQHLKL